MRWRQVALAAAVGLGAGYAAHTRLDLAGLQAAALAVVTAVVARTLIATYYRTRYWRQRRGRSRFRCPNCARGRRRLGGDWVPVCRRCGYRPGLPLVRWLTRSVPARQFRRSVSAGALLVVAAAVVVAAVAPPLASVQASAVAGASDGGAASTPSPTPSATPTATPTETEEPERINATRVERLIFQYVNDRRAERGMSAYTYDDRAADAAEEHALHMARNDYFSHTEPNGETQQERYAFCDGGENAHQTWVFREVNPPHRPPVYYTNERELASGIVAGWMHSEPHRERGIYGPWWTSAGVGVAITRTGKVYAVMGFCT